MISRFFVRYSDAIPNPRHSVTGHKYLNTQLLNIQISTVFDKEANVHVNQRKVTDVEQ